jgi:hypothetical protein
MSKGHHFGPKLSQIRALVAVAEFGSFGEAALQLGLTQPTVSHAIATLEDELGVILLARGRHGAQLTPRWGSHYQSGPRGAAPVGANAANRQCAQRVAGG